MTATTSPTPLSIDDPRHGTVNGYTNLRCRCKPCRVAMASYHRKLREDKANGVTREPRRSQHGTYSHYVNAKCRCEPCSIAASDYRTTRLYGLTREDYVHLGESQGWLCAACGTDSPNSEKGWHIDHSHATGAVRALLCHGCNVAFGMLGESVERITALLSYARRVTVS